MKPDQSRLFAVYFSGLVMAAFLVLTPAVSWASPPPPSEVRHKVHKGVSGFFFKVARALEGAPVSEEKEYEAAQRRRRYEEPLDSTGLRIPPNTSPAAVSSGQLNQGRGRISLPPPPDSYARSNTTTAQRGGGGRHQIIYSAPVQDNRFSRQIPELPPSVDLENSPRRQAATNGKPDSLAIPKPQADADKRSSSVQESSMNAAAGKVLEKDVAYATPVPGKAGFVYPPGVKQESVNMLDVRGLSSGQKARDPRTGEVFLVP